MHRLPSASVVTDKNGLSVMDKGKHHRLAELQKTSRCIHRIYIDCRGYVYELHECSTFFTLNDMELIDLT